MPEAVQARAGSRALIWEAMLNADYSARYYADLASWYSRWSRCSTFGAAVMASAAFVSLVAGLGAFIGFAWLPEVLTLVAAATGWTQLVWRFDERARQSGSYHRRWNEIHSKARSLWAQVDRRAEAELLDEFASLEELHYAMDENAASTFRYERKLAKRVFNEMLVAHDLKSAA